MRRDGHEQLVICGELQTAAYARNSQGHCSATLRRAAGAEWTGWKSDAVTDFGCPSIDYLSNALAELSYGNSHNLETALTPCLSFVTPLVSYSRKNKRMVLLLLLLLLLCHPNCEK